MPWSTLKVGAGGWVTGIDVQSSTSATEPVIVARCDTYGGYVGNGSDTWRQLLSSATMPASDLAGWRQGTAGSHSRQNPWLACGICDVRIAPSDTNILFGIIGGSDTPAVMYRSVDQGATWQRAGNTFVPGTWQPAGGDPERLTAQHIAADPINANVVYAGGREGLYLSTNANTANASDILWTRIDQTAGLSLPSASGGWGGIVFDRNGGTVGGRTAIVYVMSNGNGLYRGTWNGSTTTWTSLASGGPTQGYGAFMDHTGAYWTTAPHGSVVYRIARGSSSWNSYNSPAGRQDLKGVLVDPADANRIIVFDGNGDLAMSLNGGTSWTQSSRSRDATGDVLWFSNPTIHANLGFAGQSFAWDPVTANRAWFADGIGIWWATMPTSLGQSFTYHARSTGIEQMVSGDIAVPPGSSYVYVGHHDRNLFRVLRDNSAYPSTYATAQMGITTDIMNCWGVDYSRLNPNHLAIIVSFMAEGSGYSLDGGATWTRFAGSHGGTGGNIAVPSIDNIIIINGSGGVAMRSTNRGQTWNTIAGLPTGLMGAMYSTNPSRRIAIDGGYNGTTNRIIYLYAGIGGGGLYRSSDDGVNWTRIATKVFDRNYLPKLRAVPGVIGHLFFTCSYDSSTSTDHPNAWGDASLWYVTGADTASADSLTWQRVSGFDNNTAGNGEPSDFAFGAKDTVLQAYPTVYVAGWRNWAWGIFRSTDFNPGTGAATWEELSDWPMMWASGQAGNLDNVYCMGASMDAYGELYVGFQGSSFARHYEVSGQAQLSTPTSTARGAPIFSLSGIQVAISTIVSGARIYYAVGSTATMPSRSEASRYTGPVTMTSGQVISARVWKGAKRYPVASCTYTVS